MDQHNIPHQNRDEGRERLQMLFGRLQRDETSALQELADLCAAELGAIAISITNSYDLAQDVFQDILIKVWNQRKTLHTIENPGGYLRQLTRRRAIDILRHEQVQERLIGQVGEVQRMHGHDIVNEGIRDLEAADLRRVVVRLLDNVPQQCRNIFLLHYEGGLSYAEIADTLGITSKTVRNQLYRALRVLVDHFHGDGALGKETQE